MASASIQLHYVTVDVFTDTRYTGNPLAIVEVPKATSLSQDQKQAIAREFNFSETTFLHERTEGDGPLSWTVDIFLTTREIPFAGHPTIGTAIHILSNVAQQRSISDGTIEGIFNLKAGAVKLQYNVKENSVKATIPHNVHIHQRSWSQTELKAIQYQLTKASQSQKIHLKDQYPIVSIVKGMTFVLIELDNEEALKLVTTTTRAISIGGLDDDYSDTFVGTYFFVRLPDSADGTRRLRTRMIEGTLEDPATGSAASALAGYLSLVEGTASETMRYLITQGVEMGRRSEIRIEVDLAKGLGIADIHLEGTSIQVMDGRLKA
ncbi:Diaminopimelate epimerase-like protein [Lojkania enalia]|uniref:Diaminopimelate epimerase-like protein n=1 Tax=Lojkania enalia TaxID=147567 RepID=A0A9P4KFZ1_9PLEO|nr:Diaminopimelate epimerase-like protein [Didymosphaeria enalia]